MNKITYGRTCFWDIPIKGALTFKGHRYCSRLYLRLIEGASIQGHFFESQGCSINGNSIVW